ncbi:MAG: hypothetical protein IT535_01985, partial [Bauldia sp.]|nr:hypothetical protein [Bauldia sp.]
MRSAICLSVDRNMIIPAMFVASAVKERAAGHEPDVIIACPPGDATDAQRAWLEARRIVIADDIDLSPVAGIQMIDPRLTPATLVKLLLPGHFAGRYDKILYLDADLGIERDLTPLLALDTGPHAVAACGAGRVWAGWTLADRARSEAQFRSLGMSEPFRYFNAGVMLIDIAKWRRDDLATRAIAFVRANPAVCRLVDEDALNAVLDGSFTEISPLWNMSAGIWLHPEIRALSGVAIVHYAGLAKPWKRFGDGRLLFEYEEAWRDYRRFLAGTPWEGWLRAQWNARDVRRNIRHDLRNFVRRLRRRPTRSSPRQRRLYA